MLDLLFEVVFQAICFPIGWLVIKLVTLGKYPVKGPWFSVSPSAQWTSATGLAVLVITMMVALKQFASAE